MDRERAELEDVPPLELRKLRDLDLEEPSRPERPAHIAAGSGVVRRGDQLYVIGDDERKSEKPDLEALTALPPFENHPFGALFGIGSGSGEGRDRGFVWALDADGTLRGEAREVDLSPLYDRLREEIGGLNVEGVSVMGDTVWLLHRGNDSETGSVVAELSTEELMRSLQDDLRLDPHELSRICAYDLGSLGGVELTFSDATPLSDELLVFTASAEGEDDEIRGSVVGTLGTDGRVQRLRTIDRRWKVEGVHASVDTGVLDLVFVCDQDDPDAPAPLLAATMPLEAAFEPRG